MDQATITAACVALARANVPPYVQELLLYGDPSREIPPGALRKALEAALSSLERELAEAREDVRQKALAIVHSEKEAPGPMPATISEALARSPEDCMRAAIRATKHSIASRIAHADLCLSTSSTEAESK